MPTTRHHKKGKVHEESIFQNVFPENFEYKIHNETNEQISMTLNISEMNCYLNLCWSTTSKSKSMVSIKLSNIAAKAVWKTFPTDDLT